MRLIEKLPVPPAIATEFADDECSVISRLSTEFVRFHCVHGCLCVMEDGDPVPIVPALGTAVPVFCTSEICRTTEGTKYLWLTSESSETDSQALVHSRLRL